MDQLPPEFFQTIAQIQAKGAELIIVHGGGPAINARLKQLNIEPQFADGLRVTCAQTIEVVEMVLAGTINKQLVRALLSAGASALGISGMDGRMLVARQTAQPIGLVGEIEQVNPEPIFHALSGGYIPVIAPLGLTALADQALNLNADTAAGAIAARIRAEKLLMITDVPGILQVRNGEKQRLAHTNPIEIERMISTGEIHGGMIPKVRAACSALGQGVKEVVICQGTTADLLAAAAGNPVGTSITAETPITGGAKR